MPPDLACPERTKSTAARRSPCRSATEEPVTQTRLLFDAHADNRKSHGSNGGLLFRNADNPNEFLAVFTFDSVAHAREFTQDPSLREAMSKAGVIDRPDVYFPEQVEQVPV